MFQTTLSLIFVVVGLAGMSQGQFIGRLTEEDLAGTRCTNNTDCGETECCRHFRGSPEFGSNGTVIINYWVDLRMETEPFFEQQLMKYNQGICKGYEAKGDECLFEHLKAFQPSCGCEPGSKCSYLATVQDDVFPFFKTVYECK